MLSHIHPYSPRWYVKNQNTYEKSCHPETIGLKKRIKRQRSGRAAVKGHMADMGYTEQVRFEPNWRSVLKIGLNKKEKPSIRFHAYEALAFIDAKKRAL